MNLGNKKVTVKFYSTKKPQSYCLSLPFLLTVVYLQYVKKIYIYITIFIFSQCDPPDVQCSVCFPCFDTWHKDYTNWNPARHSLASSIKCVKRFKYTTPLTCGTSCWHSSDTLRPQTNQSWGNHLLTSHFWQKCVCVFSVRGCPAVKSIGDDHYS